MSFQPQVPLSGIAGWRFLERTQAAQQAAFEKSPQLKREIEYFEKHIRSVETAEDLVKDRRLLKVALGAFGLESEIDKKAFLQKILEGGTEDTSSLANRLTASGIKEFAQTFGFGNVAGSQIGTTGFTDKIVTAYRTRSFEAAVGDSNNDMRLAMNFRREMKSLSAGTEGGSWYTVLGSKPLREVMEKAYGLPSEFSQIDIDRQRATMRDKTSALFGTANLTAFADLENVEKVIERFLARSQITTSAASSSAATALTLLQNAASGSSQGLYNLLYAAG